MMGAYSLEILVTVIKDPVPESWLHRKSVNVPPR